MKRLMADIQRGMIDVVIIGRLTRIQPELLKMVESSATACRFVSVAQQFLPRPRRTLNILSLRPVRREVTGGEAHPRCFARCTAKKGLWMGGVPTIDFTTWSTCQLVNQPGGGAPHLRGDMLTVMDRIKTMSNR